MAQGGFGPMVRRFRQQSRLTQEELAERSGVSTRAISDVERGARTSVYRDTAERLSSALGLDGADRERFLDAARGRATGSYPTAPMPPSAMIGRDRELAEVRERLRRARLVTLVGPGGIGKTRLAVEVAHSVDSFRDGVCFVSLAEASAPQVVPGLVTRALGVPAVRHLSGAELAEGIRDRQLLLILDTFEHVLDAAPFVADLLAHARGITVLATSRAALRLRGEIEFPIGPLGPGDATDLFAARALAARPDAALDAAGARQICERVDRIPLAIELAAARVRNMPLAAVRDRLDASLDFLSGGARDLPARQRAMRDTITWSYDLLSADAQRLFRDLHVFAGATVESVQGVCGSVPDVLGELETLVEHSLLRLVEPNGRYVMFDVVREHAARRSAALGEASAAATRHLRHFVDMAERAEPHLRRSGQLAWHHSLDAELANLRLAFARASATGDADAALRLAGSMWMFWLWHGGFAEGRDWLAAALAMGGTSPARGKALWGSGWLAYHQADDGHTVDCGRQLLAEGARSGNALDERNGLTLLGMSELAGGRAVQAAHRFRRCVEICRENSDPWLLATSTLNLGAAVLHSGEVAEAEALFTEAQARYVELGDDAYWARATRHLAACRLLGGELAAAEALLRSCIPDPGGDWGVAETLTLQAAVRAAAGDALGAGAAVGAADRLRKSLSIRPHPFDVALAERYLASARTSPDWARGYTDALRGAERPL